MLGTRNVVTRGSRLSTRAGFRRLVASLLVVAGLFAPLPAHGQYYYHGGGGYSASAQWQYQTQLQAQQMRAFQQQYWLAQQAQAQQYAMQQQYWLAQQAQQYAVQPYSTPYAQPVRVQQVGVWSPSAGGTTSSTDTYSSTSSTRTRTQFLSPQERAHALVTNERWIIGKYMYPASTLESVEKGRVVATADGGFTICYTFRFSWLGSNFFAEQNFDFSSDGCLRGTSNGTHNTTWAPGAASEVFVSAVRSLALRLPVVRDSVVLQAALQQLDGRTLLEWYLKIVE